MEWIRMIAAVFAPVLLANIFYLLDVKTNFGKLKTRSKQIIIGLVFGGLACLATQFGVPYDGYVMNVRSAAPLTAGLVFGGPAGIIAGVIGALYRWFSVYWGIPTYTRVACSVATLLAGIIATLCRKYMFNNKKTSWFYGFFIAVATEVFHMLLVFLTHTDDIKTAFEVVRHTAIPMISANAVSLWMSLVFVALIGKEHLHTQKYSRPITQTFAIYLLICVVLSFFATSSFTSFLEKNISTMEVEHLLSMNIEDVETDIKTATDRDLLSRTQSIANSLLSISSPSEITSPEGMRQRLYALVRSYNVTEINLVDEGGCIAVSTNPDFDGFNMGTNGQAEEFLCLLSTKETFVQEYGPTDYDPAVYRKYAGAALPNGGFVQVGYDFDHFQEAVRSSIADVASNRHIGQSGFLFVLSVSNGEVISAPRDTVTTEIIGPFVQQLSSLANNEVLPYTDNEGVKYYFAKANVEGFVVVACIPVSEADFSRNISVYISGFMQLIVFFVLFVVVFFLIKILIVDNIHKINSSLAKITGGDLSTTVDIRENEEFTSLSNDINATVARLKGFIADAEKRIDMELSFAKSIQHSVLPSIFPPYPSRREFDIYATMDTAKEVGGDFYDFYLLGEDRLVFLIADVSGKGIPAAMFMMNAKSIIKSLTESGLGAADAFTAANEKLCENNEAGMFVTAWQGILNFKTGEVTFANAGHNPPLIRHRDGTFEYFRTRPGLVLAGMDGIRYREGSFTLEPGDEIYLYTDGVTEATNANTELFGEERLLETLNTHTLRRAEEVCRSVKTAIDTFVGEAPQFDDITMLSLKYKGEPPKMKEITVPASVDSIERITAFLDAELEAADAFPKAQMQIDVATDEIFANIASYAYPDGDGDATVGISIVDGVATICFSDSGIPFDPLKKEDPDVTLRAEERSIGGLGIFMVKKTMDAVTYERRDGRNLLTLIKTVC